MAVGTLVLAGGMFVAVGLSFAAVARKAVGRAVAGDQRTAVLAFATFWGGLAIYLVVQGGLTVAAGFGRVSPALYFPTRFLNIPALCAAIWGITSYLLYLYTGSRRWFPAVGVFAAMVAVAFAWATWTGPREVEAGRWILTIDDTGVLYRIVYVALGVPPIVAGAAYLALWRRLEDPEQRYRVALVSLSIMGYVGTGLAARLFAHDAAIFVTLVLFGAVAGAAAVLAYYPTPQIRAWLQRPRPSTQSAQTREQRLRELI